MKALVFSDNRANLPAKEKHCPGKNKKLTVQRDGKVRYCILCGEGSLEDRLNHFYYGTATPSGYRVEVWGDPATGKTGWK